jgi:hypothetical protein
VPPDLPIPTTLRLLPAEISRLKADVLLQLTDTLTVRRSAQSLASGVKDFAEAAVGAWKGLVMNQGSSPLSPFGWLQTSEMGRVGQEDAEILIEEPSGLVENDEVASLKTGETYTITAMFVMRAPDKTPLFRRALGVVTRAT